MSFPSISPVISPVSYDALCRIVLDLNAVQQPAEITTYSYGNTTYYVVISDGGRSAGKYYCSLDGRIYAIPADKADISLTIQVWCYQIKNKLVGLSDYIQNTLDSKLDTLTSVISNGKVLVDNSDVVSAIQSIPAFDDTDIITAIQSIPAYDDSTLVSAVTTISNQITEQFGEYDSTYSFPNFSSSGQSAANNKTVSGVLPSAFTSINPGTRQLLYSPSGTLILPKRVLYNGGGDCKMSIALPISIRRMVWDIDWNSFSGSRASRTRPGLRLCSFPKSASRTTAARPLPCTGIPAPFVFLLIETLSLRISTTSPLGRFRQLAGLVWSE